MYICSSLFIEKRAAIHSKFQICFVYSTHVCILYMYSILPWKLNSLKNLYLKEVSHSGNLCSIKGTISRVSDLCFLKNNKTDTSVLIINHFREKKIEIGEIPGVSKLSYSTLCNHIQQKSIKTPAQRHSILVE